MDLELTGEISSTSGTDNSERFGNGAMISDDGGNENSAFGYRSLRTVTSGVQNSAFGFESLRLNISNSYNSAFGHQALYSNRANRNCAFGASALRGNSSGTHNNAFGVTALGSNTTGSNNNAFGYNALSSLSSGYGNSAFGEYAGGMQRGSLCTFIGYYAGNGSSGDTFTNSMALGANSAITSSNQVSIGNTSIVETILNSYRLYLGNGSTTQNKIIYANNADSNKPFIRYNESSNTWDYSNDGSTVLSFSSGGGGATPTLQEVTTTGATSNIDLELTGELTSTGIGDNSERFGKDALANDDGTSNRNTAFGNYALNANTTGENNDAFGQAALTANITGVQNVAVGGGSMRYNTAGSYNTSIGHTAGRYQLGSNCTYVGYGAGNGSENDSYTNSTAIGSGSDISANNQMSFGNENVISTILNSYDVYIGNGTTTNNKTIYANNNETNKPFIRYNESTNVWEYSDNGTTASTFGGGSTGSLQDVTDVGATTTNSVTVGSIHTQSNNTASNFISTDHTANDALYVQQVHGGSGQIVNIAKFAYGSATPNGGTSALKFNQMELLLVVRLALEIIQQHVISIYMLIMVTRINHI